MKVPARVPLLVKVLGWLSLHLLILVLAFFAFVRWQLGLGLDSLLSGSAGIQLTTFGDAVSSAIANRPVAQWNATIEPLATAKHLQAAMFDPANSDRLPFTLPPNVLARARATAPPRPLALPPPPAPPPIGRNPNPPPDRPNPNPPPDRRDPNPPPDRRDSNPPPDRSGINPPPPRPWTEPAPPVRNLRETGTLPPKSRPLFLLEGDHGDGYWAGVLLHPSQLRDPALLLVRADRLDGGGLFFDFKPWLWSGLAVLALSLAFWTPFVWRITRYLRRLTAAAEAIASGHFQVALPAHRRDELGELGHTLQSMAARLEHFVNGQKRFLGDAAHELCAPLARIRTGLGILEHQLAAPNRPSLASIEADTAELATLVEEILAFSRTGNRPPAPRPILLAELLESVLQREATGASVEVSIPAGLTLTADPVLLGRALGNLLRNALTHAGPDAAVTIRAEATATAVTITVSDNGPGVPAAELPRLFEPFYRVDRSRSRDTGGSGLGLAIVRSAVEACGGEASASLPTTGGLAVTLRLPSATPAAHSAKSPAPV